MIDVLGVVVSAYTDARWGEIYEWVTLPLLFVGGIITGHWFIALSCLPAAYFSWKQAGGKKIFLSILPVLLLDTILRPDIVSLQVLSVVGIGALLYFLGEIGGGDVLLWAALVPYLPQVLGVPTIVLLVPFSLLLSILFYGAYFGLQRKPVLVVPLLLMRGLSGFLYATLLLLYSTNMGSGLYMKKTLDEVLPEDIIIVGGKRTTVNKDDLKKLRANGVREVLVLTGAPRLGPFIALAYLLLKFMPFTSSILVSLLTLI